MVVVCAVVFLRCCGGVFYGGVFCGGVFVVVFLWGCGVWWCFCGGVVVVVRFCGGVFVVALCWCFVCGGVVVFLCSAELMPVF